MVWGITKELDSIQLQVEALDTVSQLFADSKGFQNAKMLNAKRNNLRSFAKIRDVWFAMRSQRF